MQSDYNVYNSLSNLLVEFQIWEQVKLCYFLKIYSHEVIMCAEIKKRSTMSWNVYIDKFIPIIFPLQSVPKQKFLKLVKSIFGILK